METKQNPSLRKFIFGNCSSQSYFSFYLGNFGIFLLLSALVSIYYPEPYRIWQHHISNLGGYLNNPQTALLWNISLFIFALGLIPLVNYVHSRFKVIVQPVSSDGHDPDFQGRFHHYSRFFSKLAFFGIGGLMGVALFPEDYGIPHIIAAILAFFGFILWFNWLFLALQSRQKHYIKASTVHQSSYRINRFSMSSRAILTGKLLLLLLDLIFSFTLLLSMIDLPLIYSDGLNLILRFPLWEWICFLFTFFTLGYFLQIFSPIASHHPNP